MSIIESRLDKLVPSDMKKVPSDHPQCGNDICEVGETMESCHADCGIAPPPYHPEKLTFFKHDGNKRSYMLYVPSCYRKDRPIPLVMSFHGGAGTGENTEIGMGGMNRKAEEACFIGVYPNGKSIKDIEGKRQHWNTGERAEDRNQDTDDVGFVAAMLDRIEAQYNIDKNRIYATGISNGGMMSYRLACELSDRIAAVAPSGAGMVLPAEQCHPSRPVSIIHFHGTADPGWPYNGGGGCFTHDIFKPVSYTINLWRQFDRCEAAPRITYQHGDATCETYSCADNTAISLCTVQGGGHTWMGKYAYSFPTEYVLPWDEDCPFGKGRGLGKITNDISTLDAMWEFFKHHPMH